MVLWLLFLLFIITRYINFEFNLLLTFLVKPIQLYCSITKINIWNNMIYCLENKMGLKIVSPRWPDRLNTKFDLDITPRDFFRSVYNAHKLHRSKRSSLVGRLKCIWICMLYAVVIFYSNLHYANYVETSLSAIVFFGIQIIIIVVVIPLCEQVECCRL